MVDVDLAWNFFKSTFVALINKHAPIRRLGVKGRDNPWFDESIAILIKQRDNAWAKAKRDKNKNPRLWDVYRALRNKCTRLIKNAKSEYYLNLLNQNLNDPNKFWKLVKSTSGSVSPTTFPDLLKIDYKEVTGKQSIADAFN